MYSTATSEKETATSLVYNQLVINAKSLGEKTLTLLTGGCMEAQRPELLEVIPIMIYHFVE